MYTDGCRTKRLIAGDIFEYSSVCA